MKIQFLLAIFLLFASNHGVYSITISIKNNCPYSIAPATLTSKDASASTTGFELAPQASRNIDVPGSWEGRIWARFQCSNNGGRFSCNSADCGSGSVECKGATGRPPATLAEFKLNGDAGKDSYDVSLVDGFDLPVSIVPQGGCPVPDCPVDINAQCLPELAEKDGSGGTIGCKSGCAAFGNPEYCCTGSINTPQTCPPSKYSMFFKNLCPKSYSYAFDDPSSLLTCNAGTNYAITFCP